MTAQAAEARRAYKRKWAQENKDKVRGYQQAYWERQAAKAAATQDSKEPSRSEGEGGQ